MSADINSRRTPHNAQVSPEHSLVVYKRRIGDVEVTLKLEVSVTQRHDGEWREKRTNAAGTNAGQPVSVPHRENAEGHPRIRVIYRPYAP